MSIHKKNHILVNWSTKWPGFCYICPAVRNPIDKAIVGILFVNSRPLPLVKESNKITVNICGESSYAIFSYRVL